MPTQQQSLDAALRTVEPRIRAAFEEAIINAALGADFSELTRLIEAGRLEEAAQLLRLDQAVLFPVVEAIRNGFVTGGQIGATIVPRGVSGFFGFDGRHARAEAVVAERGAQFVQNISEESTHAARSVISRGLAQGQSSRSVARDLVGKRIGNRRVGGFIGLTTQQADSIISGREKLASGNPALMREYLELKLRDKRYDRAISKAIREGVPISGRQLDQISEAHRAKALGYRGRVIAKFEAREALAAGREEAMFQALERPDVEAVSVKWQHNLSRNPRDPHVAMSGRRVDLGETFEFSDGVRMRRPHDPNAPLSHRVGCNCTAIYRVRLRRDAQ